MARSRNVGSNILSKDEFENQLEDFKSDMRQFLAMQLDTLRIQRKQEEAKRALFVLGAIESILGTNVHCTP